MNRLISFLLFTIIAIAAQALSISGTVFDHEGKPMPYATVYVEAMRKGTTTDQKGQYRLEGLKEGTLQIQVSYIGYRTHIQKVALKESVVLDIHMEEETVTLDEMVVLPGGMDFSHYVMAQLEKNIAPLKRKITSYDGIVSARLEKAINLEKLPHRRTIRFALMVVGWAKIFDAMVKYPDLSIAMEEEVHFRKGKLNNGDTRIVSVRPQVTDREMKSFNRKDWFIGDNTYDMFYDKVKDKIKSLKKKNAKYDVNYCGSYTEGGHQIHIIKYGRTQVDVVDGCWQIRRMKYKSSTRTMYFEFHELVPGVFMPIAGQAEYNIDYDGYPKGVVKLALAYDYHGIAK